MIKYAVNDFPCTAEHNAMQNVSAATKKIHHLLTHYNHSVCTKCVQSKYFAMQKCWMNSFPEHVQ